MSSKFSDGSTSSYAELPVEAAYLRWTRGNAQLRAIAKTDPGAYYGGWRAFVKSLDRKSGEEVQLPAIPIPIVERVSQDGKHPYQVYATNVLQFLPIQHRTRFELRRKVKNEDGSEFDKVIATSRNRQPGYIPYRQIFGLVFAKDSDDFAPGVIKLFNWSSFISFEKSGQAWNKIAVPDGMVLVRRYGSIGLKDGSAKFEKYGEGYSTPIDPIGLDKPRLHPITDELDKLFDQSLVWKNCERWNAEGETIDDAEKTAKQEFLEKCAAINLQDDEIEQLLKENGGNYATALASLSPEVSEDDINAGFIAAEENPF